MPIINITTWPTPAEKKHKLMEGITKVVHEVTGAPLNKITVYIQEVNQDNWADAGVVGSAPNFKERSLRQKYD